jgi:hypothetical protein
MGTFKQAQRLRLRLSIAATGLLAVSCADAAVAQTAESTPAVDPQVVVPGRTPDVTPSADGGQTGTGSETTADGTAPGLTDVDRALAEQRAAEPIQAGLIPVDSTRFLGTTVRGRSRPEFTAPGLRLGSFRVYPTAELDLGYDANVFATSNGDGDVFATASGSVRARSDWNRHQLGLDARLSQSEYATYDTEGGTEYRLAGSGRLDIVGRNAIEAVAVRQRVIVDRANIGEIPNTLRPLRYDENIASLTGVVAGGRLLGRFGATYTQRTYEDNALFDDERTPLSLRFRDADRWEARADVGYQLRAAQTVFSSLTLDRRRSSVAIPGQPTVDSDGAQLLVGVRGELSPLIRGQVAAGVLHQNFRSPLVRDVTGLALSSRVEWLPTELTTVTVSGERSLQTSALRDDLNYIISSFDLRVDHELLRNLLLLGQLRYATADYRSSTRVDRLYSVGGGADYFISRNIRSTLRLTASRRTSSGSIRPDFNDFVTTVGAAYSF